MHSYNVLVVCCSETHSDSFQKLEACPRKLLHTHYIELESRSLATTTPSGCVDEYHKRPNVTTPKPAQEGLFPESRTVGERIHKQSPRSMGGLLAQRPCCCGLLGTNLGQCIQDLRSNMPSQRGSESGTFGGAFTRSQSAFVNPRPSNTRLICPGPGTYQP